MKFYNANYDKTEATMRPQFEVKNNKVYATIYNKNSTPENRTMPWYDIRGNKLHTTTFHPEGHTPLPMYEIRGSEVHTTLHNPTHSFLPTFHIR